jgi:hypothetical protein
MKKLQATHIYDIDPSPLNDVPSGYALGQWWENISTGDKFFHKTDGVWIKLLNNSDLPTNTSDLINDGEGISPFATTDDLANKADLVGGFVPASQLPSYVDDVIEVANFAALPVTGESGKIYLTIDNNKTYRWTGSTYLEISAQLLIPEILDANIGSRLKPADAVSNGYNITKSINGQVGMYIKNSDNTGNGALATINAMGSGTGLYDKGMSFNFANNGYFITYLRNSGFIYSDSPINVVGQTIALRVGTLSTPTTVFTVAATGQINLVTLPTLDNTVITLLGRKADGSLVTLDKSSVSGATDLSYTASPTNGIVVSSTGTDVTLPLSTTTFAGLLSPGEKTEIAKIADINTNAVDKVTVKLTEAVTKGQAVYVVGANGTNILAAKASNTTEATSSKTLGLAETTGVNNDIINVITSGLFPNLNTSTATIGDPVFLGTSGNLIYGTEPASPAHLIFIGFVTRVSATVGEIFVKIQNGYQLTQLHDVLLTTPLDGQVIQYESATQLWKNKTLALSGYLTVNNPAYTGILSGVGETQTGSSAVGIEALSQTWNTTGAPSAFLMTITDTASSALSRLMDLRVDGAVRFQITKGGVLSFGNFGTPVPAIGTAVPTSGAGSPGQTAMYLGGSVGSSAGYQMFLQAQSGTRSATSGICGLVNIRETFAPASGTATYDTLTLNNTVNQTGGANGITRGIYNNPIITAAADYRAIESSNGKVIFADTLTAVSGANAGSLLDLKQTWNTTGAPTAILLNVTDTASSTNSLLMDLQVGGGSRFKIGKQTTTITSNTGSTQLVVKSVSTTASDAAGIQLMNNNNSQSNIFFTQNNASTFFNNKTNQLQVYGNGTGGVLIGSTGTQSNATIDFIVNGYATVSGSILASRILVTGAIEYRAPFTPTSGTGLFNILSLQNTINQTGGANGITRGLYINPTLTSAFDFRAIEVEAGKIVFSSTITTPGTTGAQTINKISGKVNAAAGSTSLVVTNNLVTTSSIVMCQLGTNDATCIIKSVVEANGSFTINYIAPTAETVIKFFVTN